MDEAALQTRLRRIEYRQYLVIALLGIPYLYVVADYVGFALAGVLYTVLAVLVFGVIAYRRRARTALGE